MEIKRGAKLGLDSKNGIKLKLRSFCFCYGAESNLVIVKKKIKLGLGFKNEVKLKFSSSFFVADELLLVLKIARLPKKCNQDQAQLLFLL